MVFIPPIAAGEGLAAGIGMFIFGSGEACGFGEAAGICMPGMFTCACGDGDGDAVGDGAAGGIFMSRMVRSLSCPADNVKTTNTLSDATHTLARIYTSLQTAYW